MPADKSQGIVRDKGEEQPADKDRAQKVTSVDKKKTEDEVQKTAEKSGF